MSATTPQQSHGDEPVSEGDLAAQQQAVDPNDEYDDEVEGLDSERYEPLPSEPTGPNYEDAAPAEADAEDAAPTAAAEQGWM